MARAQLGEDFDVHGGGLDLIFPHHENERAQSEAAGERFARVWMHNGMLRLTGEKMSKSLGNIDGLAEALERVGRETLLVFFAQAHYRSPVDYSDADARAGVARPPTGLREALRNARRYAAAAGGGSDAAHPRAGATAAFAALRRATWPTTSTRRVRWPSCTASRAPSTAPSPAGTPMPAAVGAAADAARARARRARPRVARSRRRRPRRRRSRSPTSAPPRARRGDYARADELRDRIAALGFAVRDTPQGPQVVPLDG